MQGNCQIRIMPEVKIFDTDRFLAYIFMVITVLIFIIRPFDTNTHGAFNDLLPMPEGNS